ncbi:MAG: 3-deoxy-D-manno-octulosonic acid transferase, partial [Rhodospirillaceae bacterium]|nr:3-deoxy-D-manno-octulosonic acid transferase [Rhodospirillaceae bacterium]
MILSLYRGATRLLSPFVQVYLGRRRAHGKESADRFPERMGLASVERPPGPVVWLHAASVGEAISLLPLIEAIAEGWPQTTQILTTGTVTSADLMGRRLPRNVTHQFVPVDLPKYVDRFIAYWRPGLAIWAESEIWPNLLSATQASGCALALVNGRISPRSFARWRRCSHAARQMFGAFDRVFGQTEADTDRLRRLGASGAVCVGNLKFAAPPLPEDTTSQADLVRAIGGRPVWLAASTHPGEDASAGRVHRRLKADTLGLLTLIAPRHPSRGDEVEADSRSLGLSVRRRSRGELPDVTTDVYICDTLGEMGVFYRVVPVVVMGKSWIGQGGQNPLEPARLGCAVLFGPLMDNFRVMADSMLAAGAADS